MGEFRRIVERIAALIEELRRSGKGVHPEDIPRVVQEAGGYGRVNCYPGNPDCFCYPEAFFISLTSPTYARGRGHLSCRQAIEKLVQHMQGSCYRQTRVAVLITDSWDSAAFHEWEANIQNIKADAHLEAYLLVGRSVSEISI